MKSYSFISGALLIMGLTLVVMAPEQVQAKSGNVTYTVKKQVMTVKGKGAMSDNMNFGKKTKTKNIKKLVVKKGVTSISKNAFKNCKKLKEVTLPSSMVKIANSAFSGTALTNVTIPKSVKYIGNNAFADCENLKKITAPADIRVYGLDEYETAVLNTKVLDTLRFSTSIPSFSQITYDQFLTKNYEVSAKDKKYSSCNGDIYAKDGKTLLYVSENKTDFSISKACATVDLSAFVHYIGDDMTKCCKKIKKIDIPGTVTKVIRCTEEHAFPNTEFSVDCTNMDLESIKYLVEFLGKEKAVQIMSEDVKVSGNTVVIRGESFLMDESGLIQNISADGSSTENTSSENTSQENAIVWKNPDEITCTDEEYIQNFNFTSESAGKWVKLNMKTDGVLIVWSNGDVNLYDEQKNKINLFPTVKSGDILYIQVPETITDTYKIKGAYIRSLNGSTIELGGYSQLMSATESDQYLTYTVDRKMTVHCRIADYKNNGFGNISFVVQKKSGNKWKNVSIKRTLKNGKNWDSYTHTAGAGSFARDFYMALEKGDYRLNFKGKKNSIYEVSVYETTNDCLAPEKYGYTLKKAVELFDYDSDIDSLFLTDDRKLDCYCVGSFRYSGQNTHWYQFTKNEKKQGRISVELGGASVGAVKVSIYKKGNKKALMTKTVKPSEVLNNAKKWRDSVTLKYNVKKKGVYYIKIQRNKKTTITPYICNLTYKK